MGRRGGSVGGPDGLVVVDKEPGWTSHDVVAKLRGVLGTRKVGHSGTLDPDATGVLLVGVGKVTRLLKYLTALPKTYQGEVVLGTETSTLDASGEVTATYDMGTVDPAAFAAAAGRFLGDIEQVPPMVSAIKIGGRRLHELAREGIEVDRPPRPVTIHALDTAPTDERHVFRIEVTCSSGTYIRTLAADIGTALGGGAHLRNLRRTAIGSFTVAEAATIDQVSAQRLVPPLEALRDLTVAQADEALVDDVRFGRVVERSRLAAEGDGPWAVAADGQLLAVYEPHRGTTVKPAVVLPPDP